MGQARNSVETDGWRTSSVAEKGAGSVRWGGPITFSCRSRVITIATVLL